MIQDGAGHERGYTQHKDSFGFLRTALTGVTTWNDRQIRNTGIVVPHIAKGDVFSYNVQINHDKQLQVVLDDFHIHFMPVSLPVDGQIVRIAYAWGFYNLDDVIPDTLPNTGTKDIELLAADQYKHKYSNIVTGLAVGTETYSSFLLIKCTRANDANDTYAGEIALLGADSHYPSDRYGSKNAATD